MSGIEEIFQEITARIDAVPVDSAVLSALSDEELLGVQKRLAV
jgi:hypothetical protein